LLKDFDSQLKINIQASAPVVQIISHETLRIRACCIQAASDLNRDLYVWNMPQGLRKYDFDDNSREPEDEGEQPQEVLDWLRDFASEDEEPEFILLQT